MPEYHPVNRPKHYFKFEQKYGFEPIDLIRHLTAPAGNAVKYVTRWDEKGNPDQDLNKSLAYLDWAIEDEEEFGTKAVLHGREKIVRTMLLSSMAGTATGVDSAICHIVQSNYEIAVYIIRKELEKINADSVS